MSLAFQAVFDTLPESTCPRPQVTPDRDFDALGEAALWRHLPKEKPRVAPTLCLPISGVVKQTFAACDEVNRSSTDKMWQFPLKDMKKLINLGAYRSPSVDSVSGLDLGNTASLDSDSARASLPKLSGNSRVTLPLHLLEKWELRQRQALGLVSQVDLFTAAVVELTAADPIDEERLLQVLMFLSRSTKNLAAVTAVSLAEMVRLRRTTVLDNAPKFLLESSREKLLSAPLSSPFLFGGIIGSVMSADKTDQEHATLVRGPGTSTQSFKRRAQPGTGPPAKKRVFSRAPFAKGRGPVVSGKPPPVDSQRTTQGSFPQRGRGAFRAKGRGYSGAPSKGRGAPSTGRGSPP